MENNIDTEKKRMSQRKGKGDSDWNIRPYLAMGLIFFLVFCCCILVVCVLFRFSAIEQGVDTFLTIAQPILYGLAIGYLINPIMMFFERCLSRAAGAKGTEKFRRIIRTVSSILAVLVFILIIAMLLSMVIPQLTTNVSHLVDTLPSQINALIDHMGDWKFGNHDIKALLETYLVNIADWLEDWLKNSFLPQTKDYVAAISSGVINMFVVLKNIVIGLIVSIYVMCEKESFAGQSKKIVFALFPSRAANEIIQLFRTTNTIFGGFIKGKLLDSLIIGIICYIGLSIIRMPYALLVSVIVGVTNVIPFFGPFIGAVPSAFLILLADPLYALYFIVFVVVLQQVDGNIIGPKILGNSTGLSSFWVMFAILVGSGLWGVMGMLLGCPVFAVIYYMIEKIIHFLLRRKALPVDTGEYVKAAGVEPGGRRLLYDPEDEPEAAREKEAKAAEPEKKKRAGRNGK